jgi:predicted nucleic acid-binding Zn ribbon protein
MLARTPWVKPLNVAPPKPKRLGKDRKLSIRGKIVAIMREAEPTPFACEGPCRAGIRASLCLQGWKWVDADVAAADVVTAALNIAGAKRPTWQEGQPEWTQPGALPILRYYCSRCGAKLPEGHRLWCSDVCAHAAKLDRQRRDWDENSYAKWKAYHAAWRERQPEQRCECCGDPFKPKRKGQRFCSVECVTKTYGGRK